MNKADLHLEEALELLALDETRQLMQTMTFQDAQHARKLQTAHSKKALALIRKNTRPRSAALYLRAAAMLLLLVGAAAVLRPGNEAPPPTALTTYSPLQPYASQLPSPTSFAKSTPYETFIPTIEPVYVINATDSPTYSPRPIHSPSPAPTLLPTAVPSVVPQVIPSVPAGWKGLYFPTYQQQNWTLTDEGRVTLNGAIAFSEFQEIYFIQMTDLDDAQYRYVSVGDGPALMLKSSDGQVTLTWNTEHRTLQLVATDADESTLLAIANSVQPLMNRE